MITRCKSGNTFTFNMLLQRFVKMAVENTCLVCRVPLDNSQEDFSALKSATDHEAFKSKA